ncbi:hypothetical protein Rsub_12388 [Raphidocelis subcapitata]|uniref:Helicase-associated domain-containing protein n=1 Tax=Raphidocelis subcapitata TaxID=307507 RepID=A0A2V0PP29_9CHLO|nr:hypothetical protein Rsub_12388 [Raphidocelis subcapitata]|eukprot:GBF99760.1 hypothetical protein Rsub_12388 [Raphidocelis subcapitata]
MTAAAMNFFELLGVSSDHLADSMPERIVEAFHSGGKEAVRELVYTQVASTLHAPLHVRSAEAGGEAVYGSEQPGRPVFLVVDARGLFSRVHEDGTPFATADAHGAALGGGGGGGGGGGAARQRKPRPSGGGGGGGGPTARDKDRDATWEAKYQNLLTFVRTNGHRPRRTGEDKERQMCFWLAQQQRKMKEGNLDEGKRAKLGVVLAVRGPASRPGGGGTPSGAGTGGWGGSEGGEDDGDEFDQGGGGGDDDDGAGDDGGAGGSGGGDDDMAAAEGPL